MFVLKRLMVAMKGLADELSAARDVEVSVQDGHVVIVFSTALERVTLRTERFQVSREPLSDEQRKRAKSSLFNSYVKVGDREVETLERLGLPLYWNRAWFFGQVEQLAQKGHDDTLFADLEHRFGWPAHSVRSYVKRNYGFTTQPDYETIRKAVLRDYETGNYSYKELAERYQVSKASVSRYVRGVRPQRLRTS